jgi:predicted RNA-binding protein with PIN domain
MIGIHHHDLDRERKEFIRRLSEYKKMKGHDITVVFDGWKSGAGREEQFTTGGVRVIYSMLGEKADAVIKRIISSEKKELIVITSDREIVSHAWANGSVPLPSAEFQSILERAGMTATGEYDLIEEDYDEGRRRKGNPQTLSKREKALIKARKKL